MQTVFVSESRALYISVLISQGKTLIQKILYQELFNVLDIPNLSTLSKIHFSLPVNRGRCSHS